jgi:hypothetical protein
MYPKGFYVYTYIRSDDSITAKAGSPYYVGKGIGKRAFKYRNFKPKDLSLIHIVSENMNETDAFQVEILLIYHYGRKDIGTGILHNKTDGGEGCAGAKRSQEFKDNLSRLYLGKKRKKWTIEQRENISKERKGRKPSDQTKKKTSLTMKGRSIDPNVLAARIGRKRSQETKDRMKIAQQKRHANLDQIQ